MMSGLHNVLYSNLVTIGHPKETNSHFLIFTYFIFPWHAL